MRLLIFAFVLLSNTCFGQSLNLVPADSAYYSYVGDTLINSGDFYAKYRNTNIKENVMACPCIHEKYDGIVAYTTQPEMLIKLYKCLFIYQIDSEFFITVGQMATEKDKNGGNVWNVSTRKIREEIANEYIKMVRHEISKAKVPRFEGHIAVFGGTMGIFGDIEQQKFAVTPKTFYSESLRKLTKLTNRLIRINL